MEKEPKNYDNINQNWDQKIPVAEHIVNNREWSKKYDLSRFKIIHHCVNVTDLIKVEAVSKVSLFS